MSGVSLRIEQLDRDLDLILKEELSPEARSAALASFAREEFDKAQDQNRQAIGAVPEHKTFVDGRLGLALEAVKPDGTINFEFQLLGEVLEWIGEQLVTQSPILTGDYARSHALFVDGVEATGQGLTSGESFVFINTLPYARKIETGLSPQAPDGVYEGVAALAAARFGNIAKIFFTYRAVVSGRAVDQEKAASLGASFGLAGFFEARAAAAGSFESSLETGVHNRSELRFPAIVVTF